MARNVQFVNNMAFFKIWIMAKAYFYVYSENGYVKIYNKELRLCAHFCYFT